ncbi:Polysaccharide deacetylase [Phaffia rhodozyma]|uniref:chitin deacetylase n=1 Tax=Phaffia rhodozyma TaxID=264483 RepID=A0A0F7SG52_PHARH|nr:Polysaccharide deacetylase [Phaffia rhodozyma]
MYTAAVAPTTLLLASLALLPATVVSACSNEVRGQALARRNAQRAAEQTGSLVKRATADSWEDWAKLLDPAEECTAYSYAPVTSAISDFPTIWDTASIVSTDTDALTLFNQINATLPTTISPHGTLNGDFSSFTPSYVGTGDPACWWTFNGCTTPKYQYLVDRNVTDYITVPEPNTFGLGFDDGPNCTHNEFYNFLQDKNETATMFYIGSNVLDWPLQAQRGYHDGHEICVHTWSHQYLTAMTNEQAFAELYYTLKAIKLVIGVTPTCWRAPFGDVDDRIRTIAYGLGLQNIMWEEDTDDWKVGINNITLADVQQNYQDVMDKAGNGTYDTKGVIVLTHEINNTTMQIFMENYDKLKAAFKYITPVWTAYNKTQIYTESNATDAVPFAQYVDAEGTSVSVTSTSTSTSPAAAASGSSATSTGSATAKASSSAAAASATTKASAGDRTVGSTFGWKALVALVGVSMVATRL